jgi:hypothetical protein
LAQANPDKPVFCKIAAPLETLSHTGGMLPTKHSGNTIVETAVERGAQT